MCSVKSICDDTLVEIDEALVLIPYHYIHIGHFHGSLAIYATCDIQQQQQQQYLPSTSFLFSIYQQVGGEEDVAGLWFELLVVFDEHSFLHEFSHAL